MRHETVEEVAARRKKYGEQRFQVGHYFSLWKTYPTQANWRRVIDAANAYAVPGDEEKPGTYFTFERSGPRGVKRPGLGRIVRVGARGRVYRSAFRKTSRTWSGDTTFR